MKNARFWPFLVCCSIFLCVQAHGALLGLNPNTGSPAYADFNTTGLGVNYSFNSGSGIGTFTITNNTSVSKPEQYTSGSASPGTGGIINGNHSPFAFNGFYSLTATVEDINSTWEVTGGSFTIEGTLFGGSTSDVLLTGTLKTGAGSFGWGTKANNEFDFLFTTGSSGNAAILADFFGTGTGSGAIEFHEGASTYNGALNANWVNTGVGTADTFVPEPVFYPLAAAGVAILGLILPNRKSAERCIAFG